MTFKPKCCYLSGLIVICIGAVGLVPSAEARANTQCTHLLSMTPEQIAAKAIPAIVRLTVKDSSGVPRAIGSGIVIGADRVLTCWHVIDGSDSVTANFADGRSEPVVDVINADHRHDLVVLVVATREITPVTFGPRPHIGAAVVAIGNPEGLEGTLSTGVVSALRTFRSMRLIQTTAPISPGSSGGALLDTSGRLIGITKGILLEGQNLNFAIDASYAKALLSDQTELSPARSRLASITGEGWRYVATRRIGRHELEIFKTSSERVFEKTFSTQPPSDEEAHGYNSMLEVVSRSSRNVYTVSRLLDERGTDGSAPVYRVVDAQTGDNLYFYEKIPPSRIIQMISSYMSSAKVFGLGVDHYKNALPDGWTIRIPEDD